MGKSRRYESDQPRPQRKVHKKRERRAVSHVLDHYQSLYDEGLDSGADIFDELDADDDLYEPLSRRPRY